MSYPQADIRSREYLRQHYAEELKSCSCRKQASNDNTTTRETDDPRNGGNLVDDTQHALDDLKLE